MVLTEDRVFVSYDRLFGFVVGELFACKAKPLAWAIIMHHIHKIPQYRSRCDLSQKVQIETTAIESTPKALKAALNSMSHLITEVATGVAVISDEAISKLVDLTDTETTIILRQVNKNPLPDVQRAPQRASKRKEYDLANDLFKGAENQFYDFTKGNNLVKIAATKFPDIKEFCQWRVDKNRPALKLSIQEIEKEYERYKTPPVDLNAMKPAAQADVPSYRKVKLHDKGNQDD